MPDFTKIATCCYCGTRAVLRLAGEVQHELACSSCGARLHEMKPLKRAAAPTSATARAPEPKRSPRPKLAKPAYRKPLKKRRSKPLFGRFIDALEDIVDEIEDIFD